MRKKGSLFTSGPFAHDPEGYRKFLVDNVATSTAIEIGRVPPKLLKELERHSRHPERISFGQR